MLVPPIALSAALAANANGVTTLPDGFYRHNNNATVYRVADGNACAILSESQLKAYGEQDKSVRIAANSVDLLNGKSGAPSCAWPNGYYQVRGSNQILKVGDKDVCIVASTGGRVFAIESTDIVTAGRTFTGRCAP